MKSPFAYVIPASKAAFRYAQLKLLKRHSEADRHADVNLRYSKRVWDRTPRETKEALAISVAIVAAGKLTAIGTAGIALKKHHPKISAASTLISFLFSVEMAAVCFIAIDAMQRRNLLPVRSNKTVKPEFKSGSDLQL